MRLHPSRDDPGTPASGQPPPRHRALRPGAALPRPFLPQLPTLPRGSALHDLPGALLGWKAASRTPLEKRKRGGRITSLPSAPEDVSGVHTVPFFGLAGCKTLGDRFCFLSICGRSGHPSRLLLRTLRPPVAAEPSRHIGTPCAAARPKFSPLSWAPLSAVRASQRGHRRSR